MRLFIAVLLGVIALLPTLASADMIDDAIKARRGYYQLLGFSFGPLVAMARGDIDYDAEAANGHASNLAALSFYDLNDLFPAGSSNADRPGDTRALPAIWDNLDDVGQKVTAFKAAVSGMSEAAGQGRQALGAAVQDLGRTCQACHDDYRARDF